MTIRLELPFPPSVNQITAVVRGRKITSKRGRQYRAECLEQLAIQHRDKPLTERLSVTIELFPPDRRRRDIDNYNKAVLDALTYGLIYEDDSQIDYLEVIRREITKTGKCIVTIEVIDGN